MVKKICIVCGSENFSRSKLYCCLECKNKDYYQKHKQQINENHKKWGKENRDKTNKYFKNWVNENREEYNKFQREWRKDRREKEKNENRK